MVCYKQILRQESGVVLIEISFRAGPNGGLDSVSYSVSSKRSSKILSFDNLTAAMAYFEGELTHYDRSPRFAAMGARFSA
jgi:hypothetical protein